MIRVEQMSEARRRGLFVLLLVLSFFAPSVLLLLIIALGSEPPSVVAIPIIIAAFLAPFPILHFAAKAAAWGRVRGGVLTVLASWWLLSIGVTLAAWRFNSGPDQLLDAVTLGLLHGVEFGQFATPAWLTGLGVSDQLSAAPFPSPYMLYLIAAFTVHRHRMNKSLCRPEPTESVAATSHDLSATATASH